MFKKAALLLLATLSLQGFAQEEEAITGSKKNFDHADTGFDLQATHGALHCNDCHKDSNYKGTPRECFTCHAPNGIVNATFKSAAHPPTTEDCEACHIPTLFEEVFRVDHTQVLGSCISCHTGLSPYEAGGKPMNHIPVGNVNCDSCHSTMSWGPAWMNHDVVTNQCFSCHNNILVEGKPENHIPANDSCESCHTSTIEW